MVDTNVDFVKTNVNDFYHIKQWSIHDHNTQHVLALNTLKKYHKKNPEKHVVIATHFPLFVGTQSPIYKHSKLSGYFMNNLGKLRVTNNCTHIFGHTHYNQCMILPNVHCNQYGYLEEAVGCSYKPNYVVELE
jgi:hypothetical protein